MQLCLGRLDLKYCRTISRRRVNVKKIMRAYFARFLKISTTFSAGLRSSKEIPTSRDVPSVPGTETSRTPEVIVVKPWSCPIDCVLNHFVSLLRFTSFDEKLRGP